MIDSDSDLLILKAIILGIVVNNPDKPIREVLKHIEENSSYLEDDINYAYWVLLGEGSLPFTPNSMAYGSSFPHFTFTTTRKLSTNLGNF